MREKLLLASASLALKNLRHGDVIGVYTPTVIEGKRRYVSAGAGCPFWYFRGVVARRHREGILTVRFTDVSGFLPQTLRFDTDHRAERSSPQHWEWFGLLPWTAALAWRRPGPTLEVKEESDDKDETAAKGEFRRRYQSRDPHMGRRWAEAPGALEPHF